MLELSDDELKEITGGHCVLFGNEETDIEITKAEFNGSIANREDESSNPKEKRGIHFNSFTMNEFFMCTNFLTRVLSYK